jgi:uncharacterized membrane protein
MTQEHDVEPENGGLGLERIIFFSDAVIAIAITLLAIDIRLPELDQPDSGSVADELWELWPHYLSFLLSFLVIGTYWQVHHRAFRFIRRYDETLIWLNLIFLLCVAFLPFASTVLGEHGEVRAALAFYALCVAATGLTEAVLWIYAVRGRRLVDADLDPFDVRLSVMRSLAPPALFLFSIPILWVSPTLAMLFWFAPFLVTTALRRVRRPAEPTADVAVPGRRADG